MPTGTDLENAIAKKQWHKWLVNPGTSSQNGGYSSKELIWLVCRESLHMNQTVVNKEEAFSKVHA